RQRLFEVVTLDRATRTRRGNRTRTASVNSVGADRKTDHIVAYAGCVQVVTVDVHVIEREGHVRRVVEFAGQGRTTKQRNSRVEAEAERIDIIHILRQVAFCVRSSAEASFKD